MDRSRALPALLAGCLMFAASSPTLAADPLPRYDDPIPVERPASREVPNDGRGLLATGAIVTIGAGVALVGGIVSATELGSDSIDAPPWILPLAIGTAGVLVGPLLLGIGGWRHRAYRKWEAQQTAAIPPQGHGLVGSGTGLLVGGASGIMISVVMWRYESGTPDFPELFIAPRIGLGLSVSSTLIGTTLLAIGAVRNKRFLGWRRDSSVQPERIQLAPTLVPTRFGLHLGLAGRF